MTPLTAPCAVFFASSVRSLPSAEAELIKVLIVSAVIWLKTFLVKSAGVMRWAGAEAA